MKLPQLHLRDLFWLVLVVAAVFGAYRWGMDAGVEVGKRELARGKRTTAVYYVPFVAPNDSATLVRWIKTTTNPQGWGPDATYDTAQTDAVNYFELNRSLIISARGDVHEEVAKFLKELERLDGQAKSQGKSFADYFPSN